MINSLAALAVCKIELLLSPRTPAQKDVLNESILDLSGCFPNTQKVSLSFEHVGPLIRGGRIPPCLNFYQSAFACLLTRAFDSYGGCLSSTCKPKRF